MALKAGNDLMLVCHNIEGVPKIADALAGVSRDIQEEAFERISALRKRLAPAAKFSLTEFEKVDAAVSKLRAATLKTATFKALC
jgi:beta-N-acetylhexosaminidase